MIEIRKAFITGGAGFIGSHLADELLSRDAEVVVFDNFSTGRVEFLPQNNGRLSIVKGDVLDLPALKHAMAGCDFVFHLQANADVRGGKQNTRVDLEQNTIGTWNVLEAMRLNDVKSIVFASSATIYGEPDVFPTPENYAPLQTSLYGASKYAGEAMIQAYCEYYEMSCFIYRFVSWVGERYSHGIVFDLARKLKNDSTRLPLLGDGTQKKSYLYVKDGVRGIMTGIERAEGRKNIYNLGHDYFIPVVDVAKIVLQEFGLKDIPMEFAGGKRGWVGDSPLVHLDTTKLKKVGWQPQTSIEEGIRRTVRFLRENPFLLEERT